MSGPFAVTMVDTISSSSGNVPTDSASVPYVAGYTSGTADIKWTPQNWQRFPHQVRVRIYQGYGGVSDVKSFDVIDVEQFDSGNGAQWTVSPDFAAELVKERVAVGVEWTTIYATQSNLQLVVDAVKRLGGNALFDGHLNCVLADWNLNEAEAAALLGTEVNGVSCVGVQWASPESNPNTLLPGTDKTLAETNCDLNVVDAYWKPSGGFAPPAPAPVPVPVPAPVPAPAPAPAPKPVPAIAGVVVFADPVLSSKSVHSVDGGKTWE